MTIITIINPKGGVGKTTLTLNLGLFLAAQSQTVVFVDLDPLNSLSDWLSRRPKTLPQIKCIKSNCNKFSIDDFAAGDENITYLIDCPAAMDQQQISKLLNISDIFLIPVNPSPVDLGALTRFVFKLAAIDGDILNSKPIALIANRSKSYTRLHSDILSKIEKLKIPLIGTLRDTQNYTLPASQGMGVIDLPNYRARSDIENWSTILQWIKKSYSAND